MRFLRVCPRFHSPSFFMISGVLESDFPLILSISYDLFNLPNYVYRCFFNEGYNNNTLCMSNMISISCRIGIIVWLFVNGGIVRKKVVNMCSMNDF